MLLSGPQPTALGDSLDRFVNLLAMVCRPSARSCSARAGSICRPVTLAFNCQPLYGAVSVVSTGHYPGVLTFPLSNP